MGTDGNGVLEAARAIRPYLQRLVGPAAAASLDRRLADQLTGPAEQTQLVSQLRAILAEQEDTGWFLAEVLLDAPHYRPPYQQPRYLTRGTVSPAGEVGAIGGAARYTCPRGDYVWYRPDVGTPIEECPTHHIPLVRT